MKRIATIASLIACTLLLTAAERPNFFQRLLRKSPNAASSSSDRADLRAIGRWLEQGAENPLPLQSVVGSNWDRVCVVTPGFSDWAVQTCSGAPVPVDNIALREVEWTLLAVRGDRAVPTPIPPGDIGYADPGCTCFDRADEPAFTRAYSPDGAPQTRMVAGDRAADMNAMPEPNLTPVPPPSPRASRPRTPAPQKAAPPKQQTQKKK